MKLKPILGKTWNWRDYIVFLVLSDAVLWGKNTGGINSTSKAAFFTVRGRKDHGLSHVFWQ